ncbi:MAG: nucleoside-diphosphate kinase [Candidatus Scalindua sp.]|nr:nucleoside-diphosphate kinase [Candidatus Scalindua sp.]
MEEKNESNIEQTLVLIKPDGLVKSLTGNIIDKLSESELVIVGAKMVTVDRELAETHYKDLKGQKFFDELIEYIMGTYHTKRVLALVYDGENAITRVRHITGDTNPEKANPTSLRGKYGRITTSGVFENVIHASSCVEDAKREIQLWFKPHELTKVIYDTKEEEVTKREIVWK